MTDEKTLKVSELPEEEQKALIAEAMAVGVQGVNFGGYKAETLKAKIAAKKAEKGMGEKHETPADEKEPAKDEAKKPEPIPGEKVVKKAVKKVNGICHICGSKVVDGVCTGCGFTR